MSEDFFQQSAQLRDKKLFTQAVVRLRTMDEYRQFLSDYGLDAFNTTVRSLEYEDRAKVLGRAHSLNILGQ
jgi:hypothetical protein